FKAWLGEWSASRALLSAVFSVNFLTYGVASLLMGFLADRFGLRKTLALGGAIMGAGCVLSSTVNSAGIIFLTWGFMVGIGVGTAYSPTAAAVSRWFVRQKGLAVGIVVSGLGLGTLIFPPIFGRLIELTGWRQAALFMGILIWAVYFGAAYLVRQDPKEKGLMPLGLKERASAPDGNQGVETGPEIGPSHSLHEVVRIRTFWLLFLIHGFWVLGMAIPMVHLVPFATDLGISREIAAAMLATVGGMSVVGRVVLAMATQRMGTKRSLVLLLAFQAVSMLWLAWSRSPFDLWLFTLVFGISYGGAASVFPLAASEFFGLKAMGSIFGLLIMGATIGGTIGPTLAGHLFDLTQAYFWAFMAGGISIAIGAVLPAWMEKKS
ncbi:MAG: MFS transporter, partial [Desulfarculaceae bacterium]